MPARVVAIDQVFPEEAANALAQVECFNKHLFRPNTYLHKWWARRSGTTFRHILKQLSPVPELRDYYTPGGLEGLVILDPMMGGGTTLHEAIRMGATVIGFDLDPIPVLQVRASLTRLALAEKKRVFARFIGAVDKVLRPLFVTRCPTCRGAAETQFVLHGLRKACGCGEVLLVDSLRLREEVHNTELRLESFYPDLAVRRGDGAWKLLEKSQGRCASCGETFRDLTSVRFAERYEPLVLVGGCPEHGQFFKPIEDPDLAVIRRAERAAAALDLPTAQALAVPRGPKSRDLLGREVRSYADLFSARQRLYLATAKRLLEEVDEEHRLWLGLLVSTSLEY
ncbi:MAG: hypothetical protein FJ272_06745, partial [Planctomycetes bacterium]|nr:hypothetical protein [Planctomycetota bacterium]